MHRVTLFRIANTPTLITPLRVHFLGLLTSMRSSITCEKTNVGNFVNACWGTETKVVVVVFFVPEDETIEH